MRQLIPALSDTVNGLEAISVRTGGVQVDVIHEKISSSQALTVLLPATIEALGMDAVSEDEATLLIDGSFSFLTVSLRLFALNIPYSILTSGDSLMTDDGPTGDSLVAVRCMIDHLFRSSVDILNVVLTSKYIEHTSILNVSCEVMSRLLDQAWTLRKASLIDGTLMAAFWRASMRLHAKYANCPADYRLKIFKLVSHDAVIECRKESYDLVCLWTQLLRAGLKMCRYSLRKCEEKWSDDLIIISLNICAILEALDQEKNAQDREDLLSMSVGNLSTSADFSQLKKGKDLINMSEMKIFSKKIGTLGWHLNRIYKTETSKLQTEIEDESVTDGVEMMAIESKNQNYSVKYNRLILDSEFSSNFDSVFKVAILPWKCSNIKSLRDFIVSTCHLVYCSTEDHVTRSTFSLILRRLLTCNTSFLDIWGSHLSQLSLVEQIIVAAHITGPPVKKGKTTDSLLNSVLLPLLDKPVSSRLRYWIVSATINLISERPQPACCEVLLRTLLFDYFMENFTLWVRGVIACIPFTAIEDLSKILQILSELTKNPDKISTVCVWKLCAAISSASSYEPTIHSADLQVILNSASDVTFSNLDTNSELLNMEQLEILRWGELFLRFSKDVDLFEKLNGVVVASMISFLERSCPVAEDMDPISIIDSSSIQLELTPAINEKVDVLEKEKLIARVGELLDSNSAFTFRKSLEALLNRF